MPLGLVSTPTPQHAITPVLQPSSPLLRIFRGGSQLRLHGSEKPFLAWKLQKLVLSPHALAVDPDGKLADSATGIGFGFDAGLPSHIARHPGGMQRVVRSDSAVSNDDPFFFHVPSLSYPRPKEMASVSPIGLAGHGRLQRIEIHRRFATTANSGTSSVYGVPATSAYTASTARPAASNSFSSAAGLKY